MRDLGLGAEDVAKVEPLLVTFNEKSEVEGVKYDRVAVVLLNAVNQQQTQIEQQQTENNILKAQIEVQKKQLSALQAQLDEQRQKDGGLQAQLDKQQAEMTKLVEVLRQALSVKPIPSPAK